MKKQDVHIGGHYMARVSGKLATVRIEQKAEFGGWWAFNTTTGRMVRIKSARRLQRRSDAKEFAKALGEAIAAGTVESDWRRSPQPAATVSDLAGRLGIIKMFHGCTGVYCKVCIDEAEQWAAKQATVPPSRGNPSGHETER